MRAVLARALPRTAKRLRANEDGIAVTEFGFVAPIFCLMLMGIFDYGYMLYIQTALQGAVQEGARQASLENTLWTTIETRVNDQVRQVIPSTDPATEISFTLDPSYYQNYQDVNLPEDFEDKERNLVKNNQYDVGESYIDSNRNRRWDPGESYTDVERGTKDGVYQEDEWYVDRNNNSQWDQNVGLAGRGGAQDVVSIKAQVTYKRIFPFWKMIGQEQDRTLIATTYLRNQPFSAQAARVGVRKCKTTC